METLSLEPILGIKVKRYKITIEYDGTNLVGWQRQEKGLSIQGLLEDSIYKLSKERVIVHGAGRTDAGVHAYGQVAHFDLIKTINLNNIRNAINHFLQPNLVSIIEIEEVSPNFHARFDAKQRSYVYKIINRNSHLTLMHNKAWHIIKELDVEAMQKSADLLIGNHDFSSFRSAHCQALSPLRTVDQIKVTKLNDYVEINISAQSFLHNQVRIIVGTLVKIGGGEWYIEEMKKIIAARDRTKAGPTAPPYGLYFLHVKYL